MGQITEDYVSYETAKLLKEKGFDWCESPFYSEQDRDEWRQNNSYTIPNMLYDPDLPFDSETLTMIAPHVSIQMAMKWLMEKKGIAIIPVLSSVLDNEKFLWDIKIVVAETNDSYSQGWVYETQESACEAAIKYCIENLI